MQQLYLFSSDRIQTRQKLDQLLLDLRKRVLPSQQLLVQPLQLRHLKFKQAVKNAKDSCIQKNKKQPCSQNVDVFVNLIPKLIFALTSSYGILAAMTLYSNIVLNWPMQNFNEICSNQMFCSFSLLISSSRTGGEESRNQGFFGILFSLTFYSSFQLIKQYLSYNNKKNQSTNSGQNILMVENLPQGLYTLEELKSLLQQHWQLQAQSQQLRLQIIPILNLQRWDKYRHNLKTLALKFSELKGDEERNLFIQENSIRILKYHRYLLFFRNKVSSNDLQDFMSHAAIIIFRNRAQKQKFIHYFDVNKMETFVGFIFRSLKRLLFRCCNLGVIQFNNNKLIFRNGIQPDEIIYSNCAYSRQLLRIGTCWILTLGLIVGCYVVNVAAIKMQYNYLKEINQNPSNASLILTALVNFAYQLLVLVMNSLLNQVIYFASVLQRPYSQSELKASYTNKALISIIINSVLIPVQAILFIFQLNPFQPQSLVHTSLMFGISNLFVGNFMLYLNISYRIQQFLYSTVFWSFNYFQSTSFREFSKTFDLPQLDFSINAQYIINTLLHTAFYMSIQPMLVLLAVLSLLVRYGLLRIMLKSEYRRSSLQFYFIRLMCQNIQLIVLFYSFGYLTFIRYQSNYQSSHQIPGFVLLLLALLKLFQYKLALIQKIFNLIRLYPTHFMYLRAQRQGLLLKENPLWQILGLQGKDVFSDVSDQQIRAAALKFRM